MLFVPLPFVAALLLLLMLASIIRANGQGRANRPFLALLALSSLQSTIVGLRWGYGIDWLRFALPVMASFLPPLTYSSFRSLMGNSAQHATLRVVAIIAPPFLILALLVTYPFAIDFALVLLFIGYAIAILMLGRRGPDSLEDAQFASVASVHRALYLAAAALCLSACFDVLVLLDFEWAQGENAGVIVSNGNLLGLLLIGLTAWVASDSKPEITSSDASDEPAAATATTEDREILLRLDEMMTTKKIFRDENLNLTRLARRMGLPSRQISNAINRATGGNVSQYVNQLRVREACRLLEETDQSVTAIMLESGFQTKSNFNREFRRVTGMTPMAWREREVWKLVAANKDGHPQNRMAAEVLPNS